jgi:hypothetical protein
VGRAGRETGGKRGKDNEKKKNCGAHSLEGEWRAQGMEGGRENLEGYAKYRLV